MQAIAKFLSLALITSHEAVIVKLTAMFAFDQVAILDLKFTLKGI